MGDFPLHKACGTRHPFAGPCPAAQGKLPIPAASRDIVEIDPRVMALEEENAKLRTEVDALRKALRLAGGVTRDADPDGVTERNGVTPRNANAERQQRYRDRKAGRA